VEAPLLLTKLNIPPLRPNYVPRTDLIARLSVDLHQGDGFSRKLTLVSAPAGYGKTTLVAQWLQQEGIPVAWVSLDEGDNDPARYFAYLIASIQQIDPDFGEKAYSLLQSPQPPPRELFLTTLANEIAGLQGIFVLALDDYHVLQFPLLHEQITFLIENQPPQMHLVLLSREDPPLPIHRWRAADQVVEIRQSDLKFSKKETSQYLRELMDIDLSEEDLVALVRRTEGWAVGLHLAALSMRGNSDLKTFIRTFTGSNRFILDYLFEEVFKKQPGELQEFLLKTSILNRFCPLLCDEITGREDGHRVLHELEGANLFIFPLDQNRSWYRYHRLFGELLQHQLHLQSESSEAGLHKKASRWFWENGLPEEAVYHVLEARDWDQAAAYISNLSDGMLKRGEVATLLGWFARLPAPTLQSDPGLFLSYTWVLMLMGRFEAAEESLNQIEANLPEDRAVRGEVATARAYLAQSTGDMGHMVEYSHQALALLPEDDLNARGLVAMNLGIAYWHIGRLVEAREALVEARSANRHSGNIMGELMSQLFLGRDLAVRGKLRQAVDEFQIIVRRVENRVTFPLVYLDLCTLYYEWDDLARAQRYLEQGIEDCLRSGNLEFQIAAKMLEARLRFAQGDLPASLQALEQAGRIEQSSTIPLRTTSRRIDLQVQMALWRSDLQTAKALADQLTQDCDSHPFYRFLGLTPARIYLVRGLRAEAANLLAEAAQIAERNDWGYGLLATRVLQALAAASTGSGIEFMGQALNYGAQEDFTRTFTEAGKALVPLLQEAAQRGLQPEYVGRILESLRIEPRTVPEVSELVEALSERELEVLRLVAAGLSNRQIAKKLVLSLGTVKTHVHNIYGKLEVSNRVQAIERAREIGLI
jgi:LuxR family maltose regulon positive regulatory protein